MILSTGWQLSVKIKLKEETDMSEIETIVNS